MKEINYQEALREVARYMVRLKRPERLLRLITRYIDREMKLTHTSILVLDEKKKHFIFVDSKGTRRIPLGLIRFDADHPLVACFQKTKKKHLPMSGDFLSRSDLKQWLSEDPPPEEWASCRPQMEKMEKAMHVLEAELVVPGYSKGVLVSLLLLGKKTDGGSFNKEEISFFHILNQDCSMAFRVAAYHNDLAERNRELAKRLAEIEKLRKKEQDTYYGVLRSLAQEVYAKDAYTFGHIRQVEKLGLMTAKEMGLDFSPKERNTLSAGLILHDVGKIGIPDHILQKKGSLNPEEWTVMQSHVEKGVKILEHLTDFEEVVQIVKCHHENYDGSGYPQGLRGEQIPIASRIVSVVDAFHAIVSTRYYRKGRSMEGAFEELRRCAGTQFDPRVVDAFVRAMDREIKARGVDFFLAGEVQNVA